MKRRSRLTSRFCLLSGACIAVAVLLGPQAAPAQPENGAPGAYLAARQALAQNDFQAAAPFLERLVVVDPENPALLENLVTVLVSMGRLAEAVEPARQLEALGQPSQPMRMVLLVDHLASGDHDTALDLLDSQRGIGPLVDALLRAWLHVERGVMSEALAVLDRLAADAGMGVFGAYHQALALAFAGDLEGADAVFSGQVHGPVPTTRRGAIAHAQVLGQLDRQDEALELLDNVFGVNGQIPEIDSLRADLRAGRPVPFDVVRSGRDGMAEAFFDIAGTLRGDSNDAYTLLYARLATHLRPDHAPALVLAAQLLSQLDRHDLAVAAYEEVPRSDPAFHLAEVGRADALHAAGRVDEARAVLEALAADFPDLAGGFVSLGDLLRRESEFEAARVAYDRAIEILGPPEPQHWFVYFARAITHERNDRWPDAESDFRQALELNPDQPHVLNYLGYSLVERRERLEEALDMIERAVAGAPDSGHITDSLGWALYRLGRHDEAVAPMERAVELLPEDPIVNDHLGDVYWAVGRRMEARFQWRRALSFGPADDLDMDRIRRKLEVGLDQVLIEEGAEPHHAEGAHVH